MLNSLREWGERRSTRVFALKIAQKRLEFEGVCTVTLAINAYLLILTVLTGLHSDQYTPLPTSLYARTFT